MRDFEKGEATGRKHFPCKDHIVSQNFILFVTKNCGVTCVTGKICEYANFVSNLLAYVISVISP